jgi:hypothetical protein
MVKTRGTRQDGRRGVPQLEIAFAQTPYLT